MTITSGGIDLGAQMLPGGSSQGVASPKLKEVSDPLPFASTISGTTGPPESSRGACENDSGPKDGVHATAVNSTSELKTSECGPEAEGVEIPGLDRDDPLFEDEPESTFWTEYVRLAEKRDYVLVEGWNKSMDNLLIFAGLFSAVVTTFLAESYQRLSENPSTGTNALLREISTSMGNPQSQSFPFKPSASAVRVNCLWFCSLILSLSATVVIVLAKQWIDDYDDYKNYPGSSRERGRVRQSRYTNLQQWHIPTIIESLPTLLLAALGLFLVGLVDFL
ncbi:hypothetical protein BOTBODRAFT_595183 [Botryobasidium botryosum FD-172 SS1]|uniref:DUF6535 domain-containing protein n=1 Tax=Botryobasidium botryosum (strain FD-172 SS1) TaxID=930990 RepID=A0A067LWE4_BOTB1|nr:hypothetical protein BOTBODRAFT_595183 [Botryobasidium botryosum FD-172 SS1]